MKITCAILNNDKMVIRLLESYIVQTPFLSLYGSFTHPVEALSKYYEKEIQLFFVGIENDDMNGCQFSQMLNNATRVIFISKDKSHAADCFRLDALDYLLTDFNYSIFLEASNKALRWFNSQKPTLPTPVPEEKKKKQFIYIKSEYKAVRLDLNNINYIEGLGDYIKIYTKDESKPILSLCSMKNLEKILPLDDFIRVHRSFIIRKGGIKILEKGSVVVDNTNIPVGESYRKKFQEYLSNILIL